MKPLLSAALIASVLAVPAVSFAQQSSDPVTRAQVHAQLVAAQKAGLLNQNDTNYPKLAATQTADSAPVAAVQHGEAVGGANAGSSQSGSRPALESGVFATYRGQ